MKRVFISGPVTRDPLLGARNAVLAASRLADSGLVPFVPHLYCLWEMISPRPYEEWMRLCLGWLNTCDAILRLPGESSGADREVKRAEELGLPVFYDAGEIVDWHMLGDCKYLARKAMEPKK